MMYPNITRETNYYHPPLYTYHVLWSVRQFIDNTGGDVTSQTLTGSWDIAIGDAVKAHFWGMDKLKAMYHECQGYLCHKVTVEKYNPPADTQPARPSLETRVAAIECDIKRIFEMLKKWEGD